MKHVLPLLLALGAAAGAQSANFQFGRMGGVYYASSYGQWEAVTATAVGSPGLATVEVTPAVVTIVANGSIPPVRAGVPVEIEDGAVSEVVTPVSVACGQSACAMTARFAYAHAGGFRIVSANDGLNEAAAVAQQQGGGTVVLGSDWNGTAGEIEGAAGAASVAVVDRRAGADTTYGWNGASYAVTFAVSALGGVTAASPTITPTSFETVIFADQYAKCDGVTDDSAGLQAWLNAVVAAHAIGMLPAKTCTFATPLVVGTGGNANPVWGIEGTGNQSILQYTGSVAAPALWIRGSTSAPGGATNNGLLFRDFTVLGDGDAPAALECDACTRSVFSNLHARDATASAFVFLWGVGNAYRRLSVSVFDGPFNTVPVHGIEFGYLTDSTHDCTAGQAADLVVEGVSGSGIWVNAAKNLAFVGGLSEQNGTGVELDTLAINDSFTSLDLEANSVDDIDDSGSSNLFTGNLAANLVHVKDARHEIYYGNSVGGVTIDADATGTVLVDNEYDLGGSETINDSASDGSTVRVGNTEAGTGDSSDGFNSRPIPRMTLPYITPAFDPSGACQIAITFSSTPAPLCSGPLASTSIPWRALLVGEWGDDGTSPAQLPPLVEISSASPAIAVGADAVTFTINSSTLRLQGTESGASGHVGFDGTIFLVSGNVGTSGTQSAQFSGGISWGGGAPIASSGAVAVTAQLPGSGAVTTTATSSDNVAITWPDSASRTPGHCSLTATNASAASNIGSAYISLKAANSITLTHAATAGMTYDVVCTAN